MDYKELTGESVNLRPITAADTDLIVTWRNDPDVKKNFIYQGVFTHESHMHWMNTKVAAGEVVQYIIEHNGKPIGSVYFRDICKKNSSAEYGIFIGDGDVRGKGYGTEATRLFVDYGLNQLQLHRIFLRVFADNENAIRCYEKAGFFKEDLFHDMECVNGVYRDIVFMAVIGE